jgi:nitrogen fixation NifU-like protein
MVRDAQALYQELLLDHGNRPRNLGTLADPTHEATVHNPLCGDRISLRLRISDARVVDVRFEARGCLIARASASLLTELVAGRTEEGALTLASELDALLTADPPPDRAGALDALRGVRDFPARKGCVTLAWSALRQALAPR